jgi:hypothetical protein
MRAPSLLEVFDSPLQHSADAVHIEKPSSLHSFYATSNLYHRFNKVHSRWRLGPNGR